MKSILFLDKDSKISRSVQSLAAILHIPFELIARKNEVRRLVATGNVGMIIANTEITSIRLDDMSVEIDTIQKRNRIPEFPTYYICDDVAVAGENIPDNVPGAFLIMRSSSLESIFTIIERNLLSDAAIEQSGGFIHYTEFHQQFINSYKTVLNDLRRISEKTLNS